MGAVNCLRDFSENPALAMVANSPLLQTMGRGFKRVQSDPRIRSFYGTRRQILAAS
jgi:hypothetical protein